jgi:hypothetical protein
MNQEPTLSRRLPDVDIKTLQERKLLEAELFSIDMQVRNFGQVRDRLSAAGKDADAYYRNMQARRDQVIAALKKTRTETIRPNVNDPRPLYRRGESLLARPIEPARFVSGLGFGFGTSGFVQTAPASEGVNIVAQGKYPTSGEIQTIPGSYPGDVTFGGGLSVGPDEISPDQYDPTINYFWLHNWKYLIPFPPPTVSSRFTYSFQTYVEADIFLNSGPANLMSFVSVGETANLTTGNDVVVNIDAGWPLVADLTQPVSFYNGHYGHIDGQVVTVQRSFIVPAGHVPGVAVVVGVIGALAMMSGFDFTFFESGSDIGIGSQNTFGRVAYFL